MKKRIFAAFALLCLMSGMSAFARQPETASDAKERPTAEQMAQRQTERLTQKLSLTDDQAKQVYALCLEQGRQMEAMQQQARTARQADDAKMKSILTAEQYAQWTQMQGEGYHKRQGGGARKGGSCGGDNCSGDKQCDKKQASKDKE